MFQSQTVQQRNQPGAALVDHPERLLDPRSDLAGRPRQGFANPRLQRRLLVQAQRTGPAAVVEAGQPIDAILLEQAVPRPDRVVIDQPHTADLFTTHPAIQQHQRVRPPGQTMLSQPVPSQLGQRSSAVRKPPRIMVPRRILPPPSGKRFFRHLTESRYSSESKADSRKSVTGFRRSLFVSTYSSAVTAISFASFW